MLAVTPYRIHEGPQSRVHTSAACGIEEDDLPAYLLSYHESTTDHRNHAIWILILIEALSVFLSIPLSVHHSFQKDARSVFGISGTFIERLLDGEAGV